jgi:hypothetical protein
MDHQCADGSAILGFLLLALVSGRTAGASVMVLPFSSTSTRNLDY